MAEEEKAFLGIRIPEGDKLKLEKQAEERGVSMTELCTQLLKSGVKRTGGVAIAVAEHEQTADAWEELVDELKHLEEKREELKKMVDERSGFFQTAPASLKMALRAAELRIRQATEELKKLCPEVAEEEDPFDF